MRRTARAVAFTYVKVLGPLIRKFERMYPNHGETYVLLKWCGDGYELYVCKMKGSNTHLRILDKANVQLMTDENRYDLFELLIKDILFKKSKRVGDKLFKELPHMLRIHRTLFIYKDGSFAFERK